jgi:peptidyl-prolyl cis-trans isomerase D
MGFMEKMRSSTAPILWVLVLAFGLLFMLQDTQVFDAVLAGPRTLGEVNGQPITNEQFNQRLNAYTEQFRQQTGTPPNREQLAYYQEMVWDQMIVELALRTEMERLGIDVTEDEIYNAVFGDDPDPIIRQIFGRPDGSIDYGMLRAAAEAPEAAADWVIIEQQIRERRAQQKLNEYLTSAVFVTDREIEQDYIQQNTRADISFVRFPYSDIPDEQITVTDGDLRNYHRQNSKQFEQEKTWRFRFVTFSKEPTTQDTLMSLQRMELLRNDFRNAANDSVFLELNYSLTSFDRSYRSPAEVDAPYLDVFRMEAGEVSEPVIDNNRVAIFKKLSERSGSDTYVRARKIQLNINDENRAAQTALANEIVTGLREGQDFSDFILHSNDFRTAANGGEMGYFLRDAQPAAVSNQLFRATPGSIVGPVEADGALHIFEVIDRTNSEVSFAVMSHLIEADPSGTIQAQQNNADDFREFAVLDGFNVEAERAGIQVREATATKGAPFIPGIGESRIVMRALENLRRRDISETIELDDQFIVLVVDEIRDKGVRPLDEVRQQVENAVKNEKRKEIMIAQVREQFANLTSLEQVADLGARQVQNASNLRMNSTNITGAGREPGIIGKVFAAEPGQFTGPVVGDNAVFFIVVNNRTDANLESLGQAERDRIRTRLSQAKNRVFTEKLVEQLKEQANVKDHRRLLGFMQ